MLLALCKLFGDFGVNYYVMSREANEFPDYEIPVEERLRRVESANAYMNGLRPYKERRGFLCRFATWEEKERWEQEQPAADLELGGA